MIKPANSRRSRRPVNWPSKLMWQSRATATPFVKELNAKYARNCRARRSKYSRFAIPAVSNKTVTCRRTPAVGRACSVVADPRCDKIAGRIAQAMSLWTELGLSPGLSREQVRLSITRIPNMRIVAVAVVVLLSPAVAHASKDCMTKAEARKVHRTSYLYWHGKGRCWDASLRVSDRHTKSRSRTAAVRRGVA